MQAVYQVKTDSAIGYNRVTRSWESVNITLPIQTVLNQYFISEIGVVDADTDGSEYTFFPQYHRAELANFSGTLQDWFATKAGIRIETLKKGLPELKFESVHYQALDYSIVPKTHLCPPNVHFTQDFAVEDASDIIIELDKENRKLYADTAIYNVGGMWVPHEVVPEGIRLPDAGRIAKRCGEVSLGMWVFDKVGKVTTKNITEEMLFKLDTTRDWYSNILVKSPVNLFGKSVALVIGGCLIWLKHDQIISETTLNISLTNLDLLNRLLITRQYYDWDDIGLGDFEAGASVSLIRNPETLKALLLHYSSFLVYIDNPYLEFEDRGVDATGPVGKFYVRDKEGDIPMGMLRHADGRCIHYWPIWEEGEWSLHTSEKQMAQYLYTTSKWHNHGRVNDAKINLEPWKKPDVKMVQIKARVS